MKQRSILGPRDISVFYMLHLHPALTFKQLAALCFPDVSYETARKRLRRLHQAGYMEAKTPESKTPGSKTPAPKTLRSKTLRTKTSESKTSKHNTEKGRPERLYFLNTKAAKALAENGDVLANSISTSTPNSKHQEYLGRLAQLHLAWQKTAKKEKLFDQSFITKRAISSNSNLLKSNEHADATISFTNKNGEKQIISVVLETGNLRPTRHWIPKMTALLKTGIPILVVTTSRDRLDTLRKWTLPILEELGLAHELCMFMVYEEIIRYGYLSISAYSTTGSAMKISA